MKNLLRCWLPMVRPLLRSILFGDAKPLRNALMLMRLREEFDLVEVQDSR